jgi:fimbrial chaperone protein
MRLWTPLLTISGLVCAASAPLSAASLQVVPTTFELPASKAAETLTLSNSGTTVLNAQVRAFRWTQEQGEDKTEPTSDLVATPPMVSIPPGGEQIVRLVRVSKRPVSGEESYRIVADELPNKDQQKAGQINFNFKYMIPMFFVSEPGGHSKVTWSIERQGNATFLAASNAGNRRVRIGGLTLKSSSGKEFVLGKGLNGYVLAGSSVRWPVPSTLVLGNSGPLSITARSDEGPINAQALAQASAKR